MVCVCVSYRKESFYERKDIDKDIINERYTWMNRSTICDRERKGDDDMPSQNISYIYLMYYCRLAMTAWLRFCAITTIYF